MASLVRGGLRTLCVCEDSDTPNWAIYDQSMTLNLLSEANGSKSDPQMFLKR